MGGQFPEMSIDPNFTYRNMVKEMFGNTAAILSEINCVWRKI